MSNSYPTLEMRGSLINLRRTAGQAHRPANQTNVGLAVSSWTTNVDEESAWVGYCPATSGRTGWLQCWNRAWKRLSLHGFANGLATATAFEYPSLSVVVAIAMGTPFLSTATVSPSADHRKPNSDASGEVTTAVLLPTSALSRGASRFALMRPAQ